MTQQCSGSPQEDGSPLDRDAELRLVKSVFALAPVLAIRKLTPVLGLRGAHFLQHIHYLIAGQARPTFEEGGPRQWRHGTFWVPRSMDQLMTQVPFGTGTPDAHKSTLRRLRNLNILRVDKLGGGYDRTNWYTIDYHKLDEVLVAVHAKEGRNSADAEVGTATNEESHPPPSNGGNAPNHSTERTEQSDTTTTGDSVVVVVDDVEKTPTQDAEAPRSEFLILEGVPEDLHKQVRSLLAGSKDAQSLADLLAARLADRTQQPLQNPLLWLRALKQKPADEVDFSAAHAAAAARHDSQARGEAQRRLRAEEADASAAEAAALERRLSIAKGFLTEGGDDVRDQVAKSAARWCISPKIAQEMRDAVLQGQLPRGRVARIAVARAIGELQSCFTGGGSPA